MTGAWLAVLGLAQTQAPAPAREARTFTLPGPVSGLSTIDLAGDGRRELLVANEVGLEVRPFGADAAPRFRYADDHARSLAWCVVEHPHARDELWLVDDAGIVRRAVADGDGMRAQEVLSAGQLVLPSGVFAFPFARDLDGDGLTDLALPVATGLKLWFGRSDATLAMGASVRHRLSVDLGFPAPGQAHPDASVEITIPSFQVADQNGDGHPDLAFASDDRMQFFWSDAQGHLAETPTFEIDLEEIKQRLASEEEGILDPSNLFKLLKGQVAATVRDLDGDGCADLLLRQGSKVALYAGTAGGIDRSKATQVLKTSGNLIATFVTDDNGDGRVDLCMVQAADVSLGEVLLWVVAGGKLELDLFTYFQDERLHFSRTPSRKRRLIIDVPNLLTLASEFGDNATLRRIGDELSRQPVAVDLDGDGRTDDLALLTRDGRIELYADVLPPPEAGARSPVATFASDDVQTWRDVIDRYERESKGGESVTIPLLKILDWVPIPGGRLRQRIAGRTPAQVLGEVDPATKLTGRDGTTPATRRFLVAQDLDGDGRDEFLLVEPPDGAGAVTLTLFVTPSR